MSDLTRPCMSDTRSNSWVVTAHQPTIERSCCCPELTLGSGKWRWEWEQRTERVSKVGWERELFRCRRKAVEDFIRDTTSQMMVMRYYHVDKFAPRI